MRFILSLVFICGLFSHHRAKVILNFHIYNYRNEDNLKHDGGKCETLHYFGDHCDPMFKICITAIHPCDVFNKKVDFWKNKKSLYTVISRNIVLDKFPKKLSIKVKVDDHDNYESDHIAVFSSDFQIMSINHIYRSIMSVYPLNLNVGLQASVFLKCAVGYHGTRCEYQFNENECIETCGQGTCRLVKNLNQFVCECDAGWSGTDCREYFITDCSLLKCLQTCTYTKTIKECVCISYGHNKKYCRETIRDPIKTTPKLLESQTNKSIISTKSKAFPSLTTETTKMSVKTTETTEFRRMSTNASRLPSPSEYSTNAESVSNGTVDVISYSSKRSNIAKQESQIQPNDQHTVKENVISAQYSTSMIIIICLLVLLCISVLALFFIIQNWQKKNKAKSNGVLNNQRPLPPVLYQREKNGEENIKSLVQENSTILRKTDSKSETCTIGYNNNSFKESKLFLINNEMVNEDPYEEPIINNMESLTCDTDCNDSDYSDIYEVPIKSKVKN